MYREFEIGTAKPSAAERARVPHHLFDFVDATGYITAGEYARRAREVLREVNTRGKLPIVVGGTGLYLRALLEGLFPGPQRSEGLRERLHQRATEKGSSHLHRMLKRLDPGQPDAFTPITRPNLFAPTKFGLASRKKLPKLGSGGGQR